RLIELNRAFTGGCSGGPGREWCLFPGYYSGNEMPTISLGG
uniref:Uncharacterized protein n=1 Tax=Aegilops tauschii subsp. strangulata TaxID=200361 RepID=A0A453I845_AEGTS